MIGITLNGIKLYQNRSVIFYIKDFEQNLSALQTSRLYSQPH